MTDVYSRMPGLPAEMIQRQAEISVKHRAACEMAIRMGIPVVAGTDCGVRGVFPDMLAREVALLHDHGLDAMDAVRAATVNGARLLGLSDEIGAVETGMRADLIAVAGDPTTDLRRLAQPLLVMRHGVIVHMRDRIPGG